MNISGSKPLYQEIYDHIVENIKAGKYDESHRLPSEKELAQAFNVSRITSKKALALLAENGMIKRMPGKGSFICAPYTAQKHKPETAAHLHPQNRKKIIGLVLTDFSESYGTGLLYGIEQEAAKNDMFLCFRRSYESQQLEEEAINSLLELGVDGLVIMPVHGKHYNHKILRLVLDGFPIVLIDRYLKGINASFVGTDNAAASQKAVEYLLALGHQNIAFLSPPSIETSTLEDRIEGFIRGFSEHGMTPDRSIWLTDLIATIPGNYSTENMSRDIDKIKSLLVNNPHITCLFAAEYNIAQMAEQAIRELGKNIPEDYSVLCFDGPGSFTGNVPLTHVHQNEYEIGITAVKLLMEQLECQQEAKMVYVDSEFRVGASTKQIDNHFKF